jgi:hypothetical protein
MLHRIHTPDSGAGLATYRPATPSFTAHARMSRSLVPVWQALHDGDPDGAFRLAMAALEAQRGPSATEKAGLLAGLAGAEYASGRLDHALRNAGRSLELVPAQWTARRIVICIRSRRQEYREAYAGLAELPMDLNGPSWDERISPRDVQIGLASCAWALGQWGLVAEHLEQAYPGGPATMPEPEREDSFRVRLFLNRPDLAAEVASMLIARWSPERSDEMLQTLVQRRFTAQALPLYRTVFAMHPESELIRRRLVALCIKEGAIDEARRLVAPSALRTAA